MKGNRNTIKSKIRKGQKCRDLGSAINQLKQNTPVNEEDLLSPKDFGKAVKKCREANEMTIELLADKIGMTKQSLSDIENGKRAKVNIEVLYSIAAAIPRCTVDNLLGKTEEPGHTLSEGKSYPEAINIYASDGKDIFKALLALETRHPELKEKIVFLAQKADDATLERANELLYYGLRDVFDALGFSTNDS